MSGSDFFVEFRSVKKKNSINGLMALKLEWRLNYSKYGRLD